MRRNKLILLTTIKGLVCLVSDNDE